MSVNSREPPIFASITDILIFIWVLWSVLKFSGLKHPFILSAEPFPRLCFRTPYTHLISVFNLATYCWFSLYELFKFQTSDFVVVHGGGGGCHFLHFFPSCPLFHSFLIPPFLPYSFIPSFLPLSSFFCTRD